MPRDVRQRMIEADCIDSDVVPDVVPDDYADVPDDHADSEVSATAIRVGAGFGERWTTMVTSTTSVSKPSRESSTR